MDKQKVQHILSKIPEGNNESLSDFVIALAEVHERFSNAFQIAAVLDDDIDGESANLSESVKDAFLKSMSQDGVFGAARRLSSLLYGTAINIDSALPFEDSINLFISEYGSIDFFEQDFDDNAFFKDEAVEPEQIAVEEPVPGAAEPVLEEGSQQASIDSDELTVADKYFEAKEGAFSGRSEHADEAHKVESIRYSRNLKSFENAFRNVSVIDKAFEQESSGYTYSERLKLAEQDTSGQINALNFHPLFRSLGDKANGLLYNDEVNPATITVSLDKMAAARQVVDRELDSILASLSSEIGSLISGSESQMTASLETFSTARRQLANRLDDLLSAIKSRDNHISKVLFDENKSRRYMAKEALRGRRFELSSEFRTQTQTLEKLTFIIKDLIFIDVSKEVFHLGAADKAGVPPDFAERYAELATDFLAALEATIKSKVAQYFSRSSSGAWARSSFCSWIARTISRKTLALKVYNKAFDVKKKYWMYSSCAVCGKNIYTRSTIENPKGSGRRDAVDKSEYSEYEVPVYSLYRKDGTIITESALTLSSDGTSERLFAADSIGYPGDKTWAEIQFMVNSGSKSQHIEGVMRRAGALAELGAVRLSSAEVSISDSKYKCPYSDESDRPESLQRALSDASGAGSSGRSMREPKVKSFECGLYLNPDPIISSGGLIDPKFLETKRPPIEGSSSESFEATLSEAVESGVITEEAKIKFIDELKRRAGGGWKFSNKFFNCPTKINIPDEHKNMGDFKRKGYLDKYSYIASPISGPVTSDDLTKRDDGSVDFYGSNYYPPVSEDGGYAEIKEGTASYLVCGEKTSLSCFSRSPDVEGSLPNVIGKLLIDSSEDDRAKQQIKALLEALVSFGVDIGDLLPFVEDKVQSSGPIDPGEAADGIADSVAKVLSQNSSSNSKSYDRLSKVAGLLATAMATPLNLDIDAKSVPGTRFDLLKDLKLVCSHGHTFSIQDSVYFAKTHTGINLKSSGFSKNEIIGSGMLFDEGYDNFRKTLKLSDSRGRKYIAQADESDLIGSDRSRKYLFDQWRALDNKDRKIGRTIFEAEDGNFYGFNSVSRTFLWGSEERAEFSGAREDEPPDRATRVYLESSKMVGLDNSSRRDGDGPIRDATEKFQSDQWNQAKGSQNSGYDAMQLSRDGAGKENWYKATAYLGRVVRTYLDNIQAWLMLSTSLDISAPFTGKPEPIERGSGDSKSGLLDIISVSLDTYGAQALRILEGGAARVSEEDRSAVLARALEIFKADFLDSVENIDRRMLSLAEKIVKNQISYKLLRALLTAAYEILPKDVADMAYASGYLEAGQIDYDVFDLEFPQFDDISVNTIIDNMLEEALPANELSDQERSRILLDPLAIEKEKTPGTKWQSEGEISKEGVSDSISRMKGKAYMGRVLEASSALYLVDVLVNAHKLYMSDASSTNHIGFDIGVDLSSAESILSLTSDDIKDVVIGDSKPKNDDQFYYDLFERHLDNVNNCATSIEQAMFSLKTACTSSKYMDKAVAYVTSALSEIVEEVGGEEDPEDIRRANEIINKVMKNKPFSVINMNSDGKYRKFHGGVKGSRSELIVPSFGAIILKYNSDRFNAIYPIYKLADKRGYSHPFNIRLVGADTPEGSQAKPPVGETYVLSNSNLPDSSEPLDINENLPESYKAAGWKVFSVKVGSGPDKYSEVKGKEGGYKRGVSLIYHPETEQVLDDDGDIVGYRNKPMSLDTSQNLFLGPLSQRYARAQSFPPNPYAESNIGVPIPLDYAGKSFDTPSEVFPIVGTRIPVEISSTESSEPVSVDVSDFLLREPQDVALDIIFKIDSLHKEYKRKMVQIHAVSAPKDEKEAYLDKVENMYKSVISELHSTYRGLPVKVVPSKVATQCDPPVVKIHEGEDGCDGSKRFGTRISLYMPMLDWTTMNRMITSEAFGPDWGGHNLWPKGDGLLKTRRTEAIQEMLIKTNGLDVLAEEIAQKLDRIRGLNRGSTTIDPINLLDPSSSLVDKGLMSESEVKSIFGDTVAPELLDVDSQTKMPWVGKNSEKDLNRAKNAGDIMKKHFPRWTKGTGRFYSIGVSPQEDSLTGDPSSYIKVMNTVFPSNKIGKGSEYSPRERLSRAADPELPDILSIRDAYAHKYISGEGSNPTYYPIPKDEKELKEYRAKLKGVRHISIVRYAEAISEYLREFVERDLKPSFDTTIPKKEGAVTGLGLIKFSKKLNANLYYGARINDEGLLSLWKLINN